MKKLFGGFILLVFVLGINACTPKGYTIKGTIAGNSVATVTLNSTGADGKTEVLGKVNTSDGAFEFLGQLEEPRICFLTVSNRFGRIPLILENDNYEITIGEGNDNEAKNYEVKGGKLQAIRRQFQQKQIGIFRTSDSLVALYDKAKAVLNVIEMSVITRQLDSLSQIYNQLTLESIRENRDNLVGLSLVYDPLRQLKYDVLKERYEALDENMQSTLEGSLCFKQLEYLGGLVVGGQFRDFKMPTAKGDTLHLADLKSKVKLADFWASWCAPCRKENPNLLRVYNKYKDKGFDIISISIDTDQAAWMKAVEEDNLPWAQISDLKGSGAGIAKEYNIRAIPQMFLLDASNKIIAINLRGIEIEEELKKLLE